MALFKDQYELRYRPTLQINFDANILRPFLETCKRNGLALKKEPSMDNVGWHSALFHFQSGDIGEATFDLDYSFGYIRITRKKSSGVIEDTIALIYAGFLDYLQEIEGKMPRCSMQRNGQKWELFYPKQSYM